MSTIVVTPPAAAALVAVVKPSLWIRICAFTIYNNLGINY
jgi:hypothetical protein